MLEKLKGMLKSWKTAVAGLVVLASTVGVSLGLLTPAQGASLTGVAVAFGLLTARDSDVSSESSGVK